MTPFHRRSLFALAILACGFAIPARAQPTTEFSPTDAELRSAMQQILSSDEFRHFDHLERTPPSAAEPVAEPSATDTATQESAPAEQTWWERLRQRTRTKKSSSGSDDAKSASGSPSGEATPKSSDRQSTDGDKSSSADAPPSNSSPDASTPPSPTRTGDGSREASASPARPQREASSGTSTPRGGRPSQRGSDGVQRPVRYAPKTARPQPESPSSSSSSWGSGLFSGVGSFVGQLLHLLAYAVLVAVCGLIIALAARALADVWQHRRRRATGVGGVITPLAHDRSPGETAADVFLQQALHLAQQRAYREALGQLLLGAMSWIERKDWIRYRRGLTVRDYLRSVRSQPEQFDGLKVVVEAYEPVEFGRRPATQPLFESALAGYRAGFAAVEPSRAL